MNLERFFQTRITRRQELSATFRAVAIVGVYKFVETGQHRRIDNALEWMSDRPYLTDYLKDFTSVSASSIDSLNKEQKDIPLWSSEEISDRKPDVLTRINVYATTQAPVYGSFTKVQKEAPLGIVLARVDDHDGLIDIPLVRDRTHTANFGVLSPGLHTVDIIKTEASADIKNAVDFDVKFKRPDNKNGTISQAIRELSPYIALRADNEKKLANDTPLASFVHVYNKIGDDNTYAFIYNTIFSSEDSGKSPSQLARSYGRTTDFEWTTAVEYHTDGHYKIFYQAPFHTFRPFEGERRGTHALVVTTTKNNNFTRLSIIHTPIYTPVHEIISIDDDMMERYPALNEISKEELRRENRNVLS